MSDDEFGDDFLAGLEEDTPNNKKPVKSILQEPPGAPSSSPALRKNPPKSVNFDFLENEKEKLKTSEEMSGLAGIGLGNRPARASGGLSSVLGGENSLFDNAPRRNVASLDSLFGTTPKTPDAPSAPAPSAPAPTEIQAAPKDNLDAGRILRLEAELDRVNRELEDTKRKKREDEEDLESFWKQKLDVQAKDSAKTIEEMKSSQRSLISQLQSEHQVEIERLKTNFDRQLENMSSSASQVGDLVAVVGKVDSISTSIDRIAADVVASTNKVSTEQVAMIQLQEEKLKMREEKYNQEFEALKIEQLKVHELNLKLNDLLRKHEDFMDQEKWKVKEEWNRLKSERQIFKEDQKHILENLQKEKSNMTKTMKNFHESQHELLVRVSTERQLMEQEKNEFFAKRDQDIKRIKSEAYELDLKIQQISIAEQHVTEMKLVNETKFRQLQHLEQLLSSECAEIERMRNEVKSGAENSRRNPNFDEIFGPGTSNPNSQRRSESVREKLKKHHDYLEKYAGQKVATVAPHNN